MFPELANLAWANAGFAPFFPPGNCHSRTGPFLPALFRGIIEKKISREGGEMEFLQKTRWPPYAASALLGIVAWFSVLPSVKCLGASTCLGRTAGMIENLLFPEHVAASPHFLKESASKGGIWGS
jgi:hypothetical protein